MTTAPPPAAPAQADPTAHRHRAAEFVAGDDLSPHHPPGRPAAPSRLCRPAAPLPCPCNNPASPANPSCPDRSAPGIIPVTAPGTVTPGTAGTGTEVPGRRPTPVVGAPLPRVNHVRANHRPPPRCCPPCPFAHPANHHPQPYFAWLPLHLPPHPFVPFDLCRWIPRDIPARGQGQGSGPWRSAPSSRRFRPCSVRLPPPAPPHVPPHAPALLDPPPYPGG